MLVRGFSIFACGEFANYRESLMLKYLWNDESGQDIAEYAVMLAVGLVIVITTVRMIGSNSSIIFSEVGSALQQ